MACWLVCWFFSTLSSALTGSSLGSSSVFYCRVDWRDIDEEREREKERRKAAGDRKGCSQRVDNFYNNHDTSIHVPPKEGKAYQVLETTYPVGSIKVQQREREGGKGGLYCCYKSLCTYKFPPDGIQIDPRRTWADIINCTTRGL